MERKRYLGFLARVPWLAPEVLLIHQVRLLLKLKIVVLGGILRLMGRGLGQVPQYLACGVGVGQPLASSGLAVGRVGSAHAIWVPLGGQKAKW